MVGSLDIFKDLRSSDAFKGLSDEDKELVIDVVLDGSDEKMNDFLWRLEDDAFNDDALFASICEFRSACSATLKDYRNRIAAGDPEVFDLVEMVRVGIDRFTTTDAVCIVEDTGLADEARAALVDPDPTAWFDVITTKARELERLYSLGGKARKAIARCVGLPSK